MTGGYYKCGVRITVSDSASPNETTADTFYYQVVDANYEHITKASGPITNYVNYDQEGSLKVRAWAKDQDRKRWTQNRMDKLWNRYSTTNNTYDKPNRNTRNKLVV